MTNYKDLQKTVAAIMTGRTINEDAQSDFVSNVDLNAASKSINDLIKKLIKIDPNLKVSKRKGRKGEVLTITSDDIGKKISAKIFAELTVEDFNSNLNAHTNDGWIFSVDYRWKTFDGGTNGTEIARVEIDVKGKVVDYVSNFK